MVHCEPMNLIEFQRRFPDEGACEEYLFICVCLMAFIASDVDMTTFISTLPGNYFNAPIQTVVIKHL